MATSIPGFIDFLDAKVANEWMDGVYGTDTNKMEVFAGWYRETGEAGEIYPSQGLLKTPFDFLDYVGKTLMGEEELWEVVKTRRYILELFNHPERIAEMERLEKKGREKVLKVEGNVMEFATLSGLALSVSDLGCVVVGAENNRVSRRQLLKSGPFIVLGQRARVPFASGAMPDVFGAPAALATVAMSHGLAGLPRNGVFSQTQRQVDLARATFSWMRQEPLLVGRKDKSKLLRRWKRNVVGVVETEVKSGLERAEALYKAGVRSFRVYSPEPGTDVVEIVGKMREKYGNKIEIFAGQVVGLGQAQKLEKAGADGLYVGVGGGGRCTTAVRSSSVVDWPNLLWELRGEVEIPVIVEGGASDHVGTTLLLGGSGIGVSRAAAGGTIESPGGLLYWVNREGEWFKPYGGEASARTKYQDGKMLGMGVPAFVEGETTKALKGYVPYMRPTVAARMYFLIEDLVLSLVFRGVRSVSGLQNVNPSPLRRVTTNGDEQARAH